MTQVKTLRKFRRFGATMTGGLLALGLGTNAAFARAELKDDPIVLSRLLTTAIASEIRDNCETIHARKLAATFYVLGIVNYARRQGFSREEIDAFRFSEAEQQRLRVATYRFLDKHGVNREDPASYCPLGEAEIAKKSQIGKLLKSR